MAPSEAETGDIVCIILGASVPFVLRPEGNAFKLIGGCYVQGVVKGEALFRLGRAYIRLLQLSFDEDNPGGEHVPGSPRRDALDGR